MRILIAPDKFKGSITALAAAKAIARGWRVGMPDADLRLAPIADGGEGFAETLGVALGAEWVKTRVRDPLGREVDARYAWVAGDGLAIIDMSEASGLWRVKPEERDPLRATTYGTGQLMRDAIERGARKIVVGLGGSATTDGGIGMAAALGYEFLTSDGDPIEALPRNLLALVRVVAEGALDFPEIVAACDVTNPLYGPRGAACVFGPQKGADEKTVETLDESLKNLAEVVTADLGCDFRETPGAGAAGGIGFGLLSFCGARVCSGFELVADVLRLGEHVATSDLVITGEGRLDGQTLDGKGPAGVAALARKHGKPTLAFAGSIADASAVEKIFTATCPIIDEPVTLEEAMRRGEDFLERAARRAASLMELGARGTLLKGRP